MHYNRLTCTQLCSVAVMEKSRRNAKYKLKMRKESMSHAKSRLCSALAKTTSDFHCEKEEKEEHIKSKNV